MLMTEKNISNSAIIFAFFKKKKIQQNKKKKQKIPKGVYIEAEERRALNAIAREAATFLSRADSVSTPYTNTVAFDTSSYINSTICEAIPPNPLSTSCLFNFILF